MSITPRVRKDLCADALFARVHRECVPLFPKQPRVVDAIMSGLALFSLKDPSLLAFDQRRTDETIRDIYHIEAIPSDTRLREILDGIDPQSLRPFFTTLQALLQRGKELEDMVFYEGKYLISNDGTEYFTSEKVYCASCMKKVHKNGTTTYHHGMLGSAIVHPKHRTVIPLFPEHILNTDGKEKNDCERNASARWLPTFRREHPHLPVIVVEDALASNAPHLRALREHDCSFIIGIKPKSHAYLYGILDGTGTTHCTRSTNDGTHHRFVYQNDVALNESNPDVRVNVIEYWETDTKGKVQHFAWVTDLVITNENIHTLTQGGRARWKIENETFNTLKNQGYQFEHNFGHGTQHLATVFAILMLLAFLIDQIQQKACAVFQVAWEVCGSKRALWERIRGIVQLCIAHSYTDILWFIAYGKKRDLFAP